MSPQARGTHRQPYLQVQHCLFHIIDTHVSDFSIMAIQRIFFFCLNKSVWRVPVLRLKYTHRSNTQWHKVSVAWSSLKRVYRLAFWFKDPLEMVWKWFEGASRHMWNVSLILSRSRFLNRTTNGERVVFWRGFGTQFLCSQKPFPCVLFNSSCSFGTIWEAAYQQRKWSIWCGVQLRPRSWTCAEGQTSTRQELPSIFGSANCQHIWTLLQTGFYCPFSSKILN